MVLMIGSLRAGFVGMVPNLIPILVTLDLMGGMGQPTRYAHFPTGFSSFFTIGCGECRLFHLCVGRRCCLLCTLIA